MAPVQSAVSPRGRLAPPTGCRPITGVPLDSGSGARRARHVAPADRAVRRGGERPRLVVEKNFGGRALIDVLEQAFDRMGTRVAYRVVSATSGKLTRAEPVAALYEQGRVSHVGHHPELEEQLLGFTAGPGERSPDRLDAPRGRSPT